MTGAHFNDHGRLVVDPEELRCPSSAFGELRAYAVERHAQKRRAVRKLSDWRLRQLVTRGAVDIGERERELERERRQRAWSRGNRGSGGSSRSLFGSLRGGGGGGSTRGGERGHGGGRGGLLRGLPTSGGHKARKVKSVRSMDLVTLQAVSQRGGPRRRGVGKAALSALKTSGEQERREEMRQLSPRQAPPGPDEGDDEEKEEDAAIGRVEAAPAQEEAGSDPLSKFRAAALKVMREGTRETVELIVEPEEDKGEEGEDDDDGEAAMVAAQPTTPAAGNPKNGHDTALAAALAAAEAVVIDSAEAEAAVSADDFDISKSGGFSFY